MNIYQKKYLPCYHESKQKLDRNTFNFISTKEEYIRQAPTAHSFLKGNLQGIRRYKNKIRILYAITGEFECGLFDMNAHPAVYFLFVTIRNDDTYKDAYKLLKKQGVIA